MHFLREAVAVNTYFLTGFRHNTPANVLCNDYNESPNKGHFGEPLLSLVRGMSSLGDSKYIRFIESNTFGPQAVFCVEMVSLFQKVHYWRFHYI